jgi:hypothetical protein
VCISGDFLLILTPLLFNISDERFGLSLINTLILGLCQVYITHIQDVTKNSCVYKIENSSVSPGFAKAVRLVELLLAFASTVISGFSFVEIHDEDFYSLLDMYMFGNAATSWTREVSVFLCRRYVCCAVVSA